MRRAAIAIAIAACGGQTVRPARPTPVRDAGADVAKDAAIEAGPDELALLEAKHEELAPGARETTHAEIDLARTRELALGPFDADTCVRAAFHAGAPTAITLVDAKGIVLAKADAAEGALGPSGPICVRKGDAATFHFDGESRLQIVVWATP